MAEHIFFLTRNLSCRLVSTDESKTVCECSKFGAIALILEMSEPNEVNDKCEMLNLVKYIGIGLSGFLLIIFILFSLKKTISDMFHTLRIHVCVTWICGLILHAITDIDSVRDDEHINLTVGMIMIYFYSSSATWITCEAHAIFKALTSGIISGNEL